MRVLPTRLRGPLLIVPKVHRDERGFFQETYRADLFAGFGIRDDFVQANHSRSRKGTVRGMHMQPGMAKHVRCARGAILDVVVDANPASPTFGEWEAFELDDDNHRQLYCPDGFGHGFCVLSDLADVVYMTSAYWNPETEVNFAFDDPAVGIDWPAGLDLVASERDRGAPRLAELVERLAAARG
jgi:dTDP-4-dehydrorhamnose 3,5-epimerase